MDPAVELIQAFIDRINAHDVEGLVPLMTDDHVFVDSLGRRVTGPDRMRAAWQGYFAFCPDYRVSVEKTFSSENVVAIFGRAGGTIPPDHRWEIPAAWLAIVVEGRVSEWRVYADNKPVYDILARRF